MNVEEPLDSVWHMPEPVVGFAGDDVNGGKLHGGYGVVDCTSACGAEGARFDSG